MDQNMLSNNNSPSEYEETLEGKDNTSSLLPPLARRGRSGTFTAYSGPSGLPAGLTSVTTGSMLSTAPGQDRFQSGLTSTANPKKGRAGSLSLPKHNVSDAFGPGLFSTHWEPAPAFSAPHRPNYSPLQFDAVPPLTEAETDANAVARTLDYLGLDDSIDELGSLGQQQQSRPMNKPALFQRMASAPEAAKPSRFAHNPSRSISEYPMTLNPGGLSALDPNGRGRSVSISYARSNAGGGGSADYDPASANAYGNHLPYPLVTTRPRSTTIAFIESTSEDQDADYSSLGQKNGSGSPIADVAWDSLVQASRDPSRGDSPGLDSTAASRTIWISNLDSTISSAELVDLLSGFGKIESIRMMQDKESVFINFARAEDAIKARERLDGSQIAGTIVKVGFSKPEQPSETQGFQPTKSLYVGNLPTNMNPSDLELIFSAYGSVESARVLSHKNCGFVNFVRLEDAIVARTELNGKEIGGSSVKIGFAKVPGKGESGSPSIYNTSPVPQPLSAMSTEKAFYQGAPAYMTNATTSGMMPTWSSSIGMSPVASPSRMNGASPGPYNPGMPGSIAYYSTASPTPNGGYPHQTYAHVDPQGQVPTDIAYGFLDGDMYATAIPPIPEPNPHRQVSQARLREIRKRLESPCTARDIEMMYYEIIEDSVELSSDYIGNVVIQKIVERSPDPHKLRLMEIVGPYLASLGIHKNGTWAAQKIIDCAKTSSQIQVIVNSIRPYTPPLLLDQFGNYVVQCCLRLGAHRNQFVFDAMTTKCWEIGQGRFGARAMRTCLESQYTTKRQQKQVAMAIVQHAPQLCMNPNGAILVTWLMDMSSLPGRYHVLSPKLVPHIIALCTHKLASTTILKIVNQQVEPDAREQILKAMFFNDSNLHQILADQVHGVSVLQKVLASGCITAEERCRLADRTRQMLSRMHDVHDNQVAYKRLLDELSMIPSAHNNPLLNNVSNQLNADDVVSPLTPQGSFFSPNAPIPSTQGFQPAALARFAHEQQHQMTGIPPSTWGASMSAPLSATHANGFYGEDLPTPSHSPIPHGMYGTTGTPGRPSSAQGIPSGNRGNDVNGIDPFMPVPSSGAYPTPQHFQGSDDQKTQ